MDRLTRPTPVNLSASSGTITPDAAVAMVFRHAATADVILAEPVNGMDGQAITVLVQASGGARTLSIAGVTWASIPSGQWWIGELRYEATSATWLIFARQTTSMTPVEAGDGGTSGVAETWTGVDGAAWPAGWTVQGGAGTIAANKGRLSTDGVFSAAWLSLMSALANFDETVTFACSNVSEGGDVRVGVSSAALTSSKPTRGHAVRFNIAANNSQIDDVVLNSFAAGSATELGYTYLGLASGAAGWTARIQRIGTAIKAKVWAADTTEPAAWTLSATDTNSPASSTDRVFLSYEQYFNGSFVDFDDLVVTVPS